MYIRPHGKGHRVEVHVNGRRKSKVFPTKRAAQAWGHEQEGTTKALGKGWRTLGEAIQQYQETYTSRKRSGAWEENTLARLAAVLGSDTPLGAIDQPTIAAWRDKRLQTVSGSTVQREANVLRHLFRVARDEWHWIDRDPFKGVRLPAENQPRHQVWRWQQIKRVLRAPREGKTRETQVAFHISLRTAMRLNEVLRAPEGFDSRRRVVVLGSDKGTKGRVEIPVNRKAAKLLTGVKFTVTPNEASVLFGNLCRELLIDDLTFHDARATALTLMARRVDVLTLAKISRHKDLRILQNTYYRETAEEIAARL
jgi:integrase